MVNLPVTVPPTDGVNVPAEDDCGHTRASDTHGCTESPATVLGMVALHGGVVDGPILAANDIEETPHGAAASAGASRVHVRDVRPGVGGGSVLLH